MKDQTIITNLRQHIAEMRLNLIANKLTIETLMVKLKKKADERDEEREEARAQMESDEKLCLGLQSELEKTIELLDDAEHERNCLKWLHEKAKKERDNLQTQLELSRTNNQFIAPVQLRELDRLTKLVPILTVERDVARKISKAIAASQDKDDKVLNTLIHSGHVTQNAVDAAYELIEL